MAEGLYEKLKRNAAVMLPMHMPGHKRNLALSGEKGYLAALCAECDITEIAGFDNLAEPEGILAELKVRAAALWSSEETYPLVNGSTCGILAAIYATVRRGDAVIMARNCHRSVYNGMELTGARATYLFPEQDPATGICGSITPKAVEEALRKVPETKLVIVTSPTYEGIISDIEGICQAAHAHGVPVLVDSAHGAHLSFGSFPKGAVECGADLVVQSLHKTMPCLTQTAFLHRKGTFVVAERLQSAVNLFQTSSPSYLLLASIDGCVGLLEEKREELFAGWQEALEAFYEEGKGLRRLKVLKGVRASGGEPEEAVYSFDQSKLILSTEGTGLTGRKLSDLLRTRYQIELEMAAEQYAIAMTGMGDTKGSLLRLAKALKEIDESCGAGRDGQAQGYADGQGKCGEQGSRKKFSYPQLPECCYSVEEALAASSAEHRLTEAVGRIAAEYVWAYPPGIPLLVPGERISEEMAAFLRQKEEYGVGVHRTGGRNGDTVRCIK